MVKRTSGWIGATIPDHATPTLRDQGRVKRDGFQTDPLPKCSHPEAVETGEDDELPEELNDLIGQLTLRDDWDGPDRED